MSASDRKHGSTEPPASVVVPCFNQGRFLAEAIESLLSQRGHVPEIIVVDDGSTDDTASVASRYGDRVQLIRQDNRGLPNARNVGLAAARGRFVAFVDADDAWDPEFLSTTMPILERPGVRGVYTCTRIVDEEGMFMREAGKIVAPEDFRPALLRGGFFPPAAALLEASAVRDVGGFDESLAATEDDLWYRLQSLGSFHGIARPLCRYRVHSQSMSEDVDLMHGMRLRVVEKHFGPEEGSPPSWPSEKRCAYGYAYRNSALGHLHAGDDELAVRLLRRAAACWPETLLDVDTHYEILCGEQPRSVRGRAELLDLEARVAALDALIAAVLDDSDDELRHLERSIRSRARLAAGMLADQAGKGSLARRLLLRALWTTPTLGLRHRLPRRLLRLSLGPRIGDMLRRRRPDEDPDTRAAHE